MTEFSVILLARSTEAKLLRRNLPSWCTLKPSEIIIGLDKPAAKECIDVANEIASQYSTNVKVIEIDRNPEYKMHQAWARRKCFREAKHDIIFTGDADLSVFPSCLRALDLIGKNNIGLVSLMKVRSQKSFGGIVRNLINGAIKKYQERRGHLDQRGYFTGLYCIYRPYWLDSEDEDSIKKMPHPYDSPLLIDSQGGYLGEDTHLHNHMKKKHQCVYLSDIGAMDLRPGLEQRTQIQTKMGMMLAYEGKHPITVFGMSVIDLRFHIMGSYVRQLKKIHKQNITTQQIYRIIISGLISIGLRLASKKEINLKSALSLYRHEFPVSTRLTKFKGRLFVDIGANKGYYTILLRNNFERIICFEPATSFTSLIQNIEEFGIASKVRAEKLAISEHDGEICFYLARKENANDISVTKEQLISNYNILDKIEHQLVKTEKVKGISLASYLKDEQSIDLIKVDVVGSEWQVLEGAIPIIDRVRSWLVELYVPNRSTEMQEWFGRYGYQTELLTRGPRSCHILAFR